jgi:hypothetical protein
MEIDAPEPSCYTYLFKIHGRRRVRESRTVRHLSLATIAFICSQLPTLAASAQATLVATISSPVADRALQGTVVITGTADAPDFASADLSFAYASDTANAWFSIRVIDRPIQESQLASWDTSLVSDGEYVLRLRVMTLGGNHLDALVPLQVRNYTAPALAVASATPTAAPWIHIPTPMLISASPTVQLPPPASPTPLPPNPAALTTLQLEGGFWRGSLLVAGLFVLIGIIVLRRRPG